MHNVKDLIVKCDRDKLCKEFLLLCKDIPEDKYDVFRAVFFDFLDRISAKEADKNDDQIVICSTAYDHWDVVSYPGSAVYSVSDIVKYFRKNEAYEKLNGVPLESLRDEDISELDEKDKELLNKRNDYDIKGGESYPGYIQGCAYEFSDWSEILGFMVPDYVYESDDGCVFAAAVIYEMTFFGYEEEKMLSEREKLYESMEETERLLKMPEEEQKKHFTTIEELFAEIGYTDDRTEAEKERDEKSLIRSNVLSSISRYREMRKVYNELMV